MKHASNPAGQTVYISGPITNNPNFVQQFDEAKDLLLKLGYARVLTPTLFPPGWSYEEYMEHCMLMVRHANVVVMLQGWANSPGATAERAYARSLKREVLELTTHPMYGLWLEGVSQGVGTLYKEVADRIQRARKGLDGAAPATNPTYTDEYIADQAALVRSMGAVECELYLQKLQQLKPLLHTAIIQRVAGLINQEAAQTIHLAHSGVVPRAVAFGALGITDPVEVAIARAKEAAEIAGMQEAKAEALQRAKNGIAKLYADYVDACREMISLYPDNHVEIPAPRVLPGPVPKPAEVFQAAAGDVMADEILNMPWLVQPEAAGLLANEIDAFDELGELCNQFAEAVSAWMQSVPSLKDASHIHLVRWIAARLSPKQQHRYLSDPFETPEYLAKPPSVLLVLRTEPCGIGYRLVFNAEQIKTGWTRGLEHVMALYWLREPTPDEEAEVAPLRARIVMYPSGKAVLKYVSTGAESCDLHIVDGDKSIAEYLKKQSGTSAQETESAVERAVAADHMTPARLIQPEKFRQAGKSWTMTDLIRITCVRSLREHFKRVTGLEPTHAIRGYDNAQASDEEFQKYKELACDLCWVDPRTTVLETPCAGEVAGMCCFYLAHRQANGAWIVAQPKADAHKEWAEICGEPIALVVLRQPPDAPPHLLTYTTSQLKAGAIRGLNHVSVLYWQREPTPEELAEVAPLRAYIMQYPGGAETVLPKGSSVTNTKSSRAAIKPLTIGCLYSIDQAQIESMKPMSVVEYLRESLRGTVTRYPSTMSFTLYVNDGLWDLLTHDILVGVAVEHATYSNMVPDTLYFHLSAESDED